MVARGTCILMCLLNVLNLDDFFLLSTFHLKLFAYSYEKYVLVSMKQHQ